MKKKISETCLLEIKAGDVIQERNHKKRVGVVNSFHMVPNSNKKNSELICVIVMTHIDEIKGACKISATSDKFQAYENYEYEEYYPSQF